MGELKILVAASLHEADPAGFPPSPSPGDIAAIAPGNVLVVYAVRPAGGYLLAMMAVRPREEWPEGMFKCTVMSDLTELGVDLDSPISLTADVIAEIHEDATAVVGTLFGRPGTRVYADGELLE